MRIARDDTNVPIQGVYNRMLADVLAYTDAYAVADIALAATVAGAYVYADGAHPVLLTINGGADEYLIPNRVIWPLPVALSSFNARSTEAADAGNLHIWGGY